VKQLRAYIEGHDAAGRTAAQAADELTAEFSSADFNIERISITVDGREAVVLDDMPGQDTSRQVVIVHNGRLYKLTFVPEGEDYGDAHAQTENLYATVVNSFKFLSKE
jgi:hypothetical protein